MKAAGQRRRTNGGLQVVDAQRQERTAVAHSAAAHEGSWHKPAKEGTGPAARLNSIMLTLSLCAHLYGPRAAPLIPQAARREWPRSANVRAIQGWTRLTLLGHGGGCPNCQEEAAGWVTLVLREAVH